jgi:DNA-binding transcriptional LysR family regulator
MSERTRIERRISLRDLRVLVSVVESGSMGRAAKLLATSQPAISRSIADLEHAFGVRLLDRSAHGVEPTLYGRALLKRGVAMFDELGQGIKDIRFLADPDVGDIIIAASIANAEGLVCSAMSELCHRYPRLSFDVLATDTTTAYRALLDRRVDVAVVHVIEPIATEPLDAETLVLDPHVVVAGAHHPLTRRRGLKLSDLLDEPWAMPPPGSPYRSVVFEAFRASKLEMPHSVVSSTLPVRTTMLATGHFLSMVPRSVMQFSPKNRLLKALPIDLPTTVRPLALVTLRNRTLNPVVEIFANQLRAVVKRLTAPRVKNKSA